MDIVKKFKALPSTLGIQANPDHFQYLNTIIEQELKKFSHHTQLLIQKLLISFASGDQIIRESEKQKIHNIFLFSEKYRKKLETLYENIEQRFQMQN
ncbi:MAG: hypothetical protein BAJALOKI1v1_640007 [Promethearchaeota archaeon]|nr:MAG: hypothetical protein BAJALOKI1v1_640007 [Candidatus Lokiarchaeota archaeon]